MNLTELIEIARRNARSDGQWTNYEWIKTVGLLSIEFQRLNLVKENWRGWIYHVPIPPGAAKIQYRDVKMDQSKYDYDRIVAHAARMARDAIVVTDVAPNGGSVAISHDHKPYWLRYVEYPFNPLEPMYERCRAMCAYVHSQAFNSPTVFLDGDAFVNTDLNPIFKTIRDVAVTYRNDPGLMPINEGVIFAKPTEGTRAFFRAYLATYENLAKVPEIVEYYGDIKRWRGGQLSLNALACPPGVPSEMDRLEVAGAHIQYLPCATFNFSMAMDQPLSKATLDQKMVVHMKGPRKVLFEQIRDYQESKHANL